MTTADCYRLDESAEFNIYKNFFEHSNTGNAIISQQNKWITFNNRLCELLCFSKEQMHNLTWYDLVHKDQRENDRELFSCILNDEIKTSCFETKIVRGDGITITALVSLSGLTYPDIDDRAIGFQLTDVTSRAQFEETLRKNEFDTRRNLEELEWIYSNAPIGLCHFDIDLRYKRINKFLAEINGLPPNAHIGKTIESILPKIATTAKQVKETILHNKRPFHQEFKRDTLKSPDNFRFFNESWYPLFDEMNNIIGFGAVVEEITEKKHVLALKAADRRKNELLATLAHELRNPIGSVSAALEMMRIIDDSDDAAPSRDRKYLDRAERQINHMKRLVEDILTVTRIQQGKIDLRIEKIDINTIANQAIEIMQPKIDEKQLQFIADIPIEPYILDIDALRMTQVVINLLDNAIKFTNNGGKIRLTISREANDVILIVRDTGVGISQKSLPRIFEIFNQIEVHPGKKNEGVGIGLAVVKNVVELHKGTVEARSDGINRGSSFIVRLPNTA